MRVKYNPASISSTQTSPPPPPPPPPPPRYCTQYPLLWIMTTTYRVQGVIATAIIICIWCTLILVLPSVEVCPDVIHLHGIYIQTCVQSLHTCIIVTQYCHMCYITTHVMSYKQHHCTCAINTYVIPSQIQHTTSWINFAHDLPTNVKSLQVVLLALQYSVYSRVITLSHTH